jgi:hypothetical protein
MSLRIAVLAAVAMVLSACGGTSWPAPAGYSEHEIEVAVIGTCQKSVKDGLKDSGSAKFGGDW